MISKNIKKFILLFGLISVCAYGQDKEAVYLDDTKPINDRVEDALKRMTTEEKVAILHAQSKFSSAGVPRLGIPELWMSDGPHGNQPPVFYFLPSS